MPLNQLWGMSANRVLQQQGGPGPIVWTLWIIGLVSTVVTTTFIVRWMLESRRCTRKQLQHQVSLNMEVRLARTVVYFPIHICILACATLFYPATAYSLEMVMAIAASVVMGCLVQYYLNALGGGRFQDPSSERLLEQTPEKKWWMHSCMGGVNDMLPAMGYIYSRRPHKLTLPDIHRAVHLVELFMVIYISTSVWNVGLMAFPTEVYMDADGWCKDTNVVPSWLSTTITILQILSTFVGSAGFAIISNAANEVYQALDPENDYNLKRKAGVGGCYLALPLLKVVMGPLIRLLHLTGKRITMPVSVPAGPSTMLQNGQYTTTYKTLNCPVFDSSVVEPMLFCAVVTVFMAYIAVVQTRIYQPGETFEDLYASAKGLGHPDPTSESSGSDIACA